MCVCMLVCVCVHVLTVHRTQVVFFPTLVSAAEKKTISKTTQLTDAQDMDHTIIYTTPFPMILVGSCECDHTVITCNGKHHSHSTEDTDLKDIQASNHLIGGCVCERRQKGNAKLYSYGPHTMRTDLRVNSIYSR